MLSITNLHVSYGAIRALHGISIEVNEGEIVALIGSNGAGNGNTDEGRKGKKVRDGLILKGTSKNRNRFSKTANFDPSLTVGALCLAIFRGCLNC